MLILFIVSGGILFNDRFRRNWFAIACAAALAMVSTYYLTRQIVHEVFLEEMARVDQSPEVQGPDVPDGSAPEPHVLAPPRQRVEPAVPPADKPDALLAISPQEVQDVFRAYLRAWQDGDVDTQDRLLDDSFSYIDQENKRQYKAAYIRQKRQLASRYGASPANSNITIEATNVEVETKGDIGTVTYDQAYHSPYYSSTGKNRFVIRKFPDGVRIIEEVFARQSYALNPDN